MNISSNIKKLREQRGLLQKEVAEAIGIYASNYSRIEKGERQLTIEMLPKLARLFGCSIEEIIYLDESKPTEEITIEDESLLEQLRLIKQLDDKDRDFVYRAINTTLTKQKFKDFIEKNLDF